MTLPSPMLELTPTRASGQGTQPGTAAAVVERVRTRARLHSAWMERLWSEGQTSDDQGLCLAKITICRVISQIEV